MKLEFKEKFYSIPQGTEIVIRKNQVNLWVGSNGSGKTVAAAAVMSHVGKKKHQWFAEIPASQLSKIEFSGFEGISEISFSSAKMRQTQFCDLDVVLSLPGSVSRLNASEGQNAGADLVDSLKHKDDPDHLFIYDEIDSHFDVRTKIIFFTKVLPFLKGTVIVVTHDMCFIPEHEEVLDFNERMRKLLPP